eukprot:scaffold4052_cov213-Amphora_coffeaeformis.AAC.5
MKLASITTSLAFLVLAVLSRTTTGQGTHDHPSDATMIIEMESIYAATENYPNPHPIPDPPVRQHSYLRQGIDEEQQK